MVNVTLLSKPSCVQCTASVRGMNGKKLPFTKIDMSVDATALELARSLGYMQAPVTTVTSDGEIVDHWSGYRPDKIDEWTGKLAEVNA